MLNNEHRFWSSAALIIAIASLYVGYLSLVKKEDIDQTKKPISHSQNTSQSMENNEGTKKDSISAFLSTNPSNFILVTGLVGPLEEQTYVSVPTVQRKEISGEAYIVGKARTFYFGKRYKGGVREKISDFNFGCESATVFENADHLDEKGNRVMYTITAGDGIRKVWNKDKGYMTDEAGNRVNTDNIAVEIKEINEPRYRSLYNFLCKPSSFEAKNSLFVKNLYDPSTVAKALYTMSNSINN